MKRPLFVVGIVFALGEVISRFCMNTEYIEAAVIGSVILPALLYFACKTVLQGRTVFLLITGSFLMGVLWGWFITELKKPLPAGTRISGSFVISRLSQSGDGYSMELVCGNDRYYAYMSNDDLADCMMLGDAAGVRDGEDGIGQRVGQDVAGWKAGRNVAELGVRWNEAGLSDGCDVAGRSDGQDEMRLGAGQDVAMLSNGRDVAGVSYGQDVAGWKAGRNVAELGVGQNEVGQSDGCDVAGQSDGQGEMRLGAGQDEAGWKAGRNVAELGVGQNEAGQSDGHDGIVLRVGQGYRFSGEVEEISGPTNPGQFDHRRYLLGRGIRRKIDIFSIERCKRYDSHLRIFLDKCRESFTAVIRDLMPEKYSGVLSAMLFGEKSWMDSDMRKLFQANGIAHILAISSLHMAFFASIASWILSRFGAGRILKTLLTIILLFLYGMMTGFSEATVRAFIMLTAVCLAGLFGRTTDAPTSMVTALLVMLIINPDCIMSQGFQLSYAAAAGMIVSGVIYNAIYENERFKGINRRIRKRYKHFVMGLITSVSLNVFMLPLIAGGYYEVPLYSMAVNFIIIPLLFFAIAFGFAAAVAGVIGTAAGNAAGLPVIQDVMMYMARMLAFPAECVLRFYEWICRVFMRLPLARINTGRVRMWEYMVYGLLLLLIVLYFGRTGHSERTSGKAAKKHLAGLRLLSKNYLHRKREKHAASTYEEDRGREVRRGIWYRFSCFHRKRAKHIANINDVDRRCERRRGISHRFSCFYRKRAKHIANINDVDRRCERRRGMSYMFSCFYRKREKHAVNIYEANRKREVRRCIGYIFSCFLLECILLVGTIFLNRERSYAVFLDVGQGNASFVHTAQGVNVIYDCGSTSKNDVGRDILVPALKYSSASEIDVVFLSHSDADHINGLIYLFENCFMEGVKVDKLCLAKGIQMDESLERLISAARKTGCEIVYVSAGDVICAGDARMEIIYPYVEDEYETGYVEEEYETGYVENEERHGIEETECSNGGATSDPADEKIRGSKDAGRKGIYVTGCAEDEEVHGTEDAWRRNGGATTDPADEKVRGSKDAGRKGIYVTGCAEDEEVHGTEDAWRRKAEIIPTVSATNEPQYYENMYIAGHGAGDQRYSHSSDVDKNEYSLVVRFIYGDTSILFTGDIGGEAEQIMVDACENRNSIYNVDNDAPDGEGSASGVFNDYTNSESSASGVFNDDKNSESSASGVLNDKTGNGSSASGVFNDYTNSESSASGVFNIDSDIMVCPHHGSKYSSSEEYVEAVSPETVIISCGRNNLYGHPAKETLERLDQAGCEVFRTDEEGAVIVELP